MFKNTTSAFKVSVIYFIFSLLWIFFSDSAINFLAKDFETVQFLQTIKGGFFVTISSILLYILTRQIFINIQDEKEKLAQTSNLLENIINNAPLKIFWKDKNGVYIGANKSFIDFMSLQNEKDFIGKKDSELNIREKESFIKDDLYVMSNNKVKLHFTEIITKENGEINILNTSKVPLLNEKNEVIGILGVFEDITEQVNNQKQINLQEQLLIQLLAPETFVQLAGVNPYSQPKSIRTLSRRNFVQNGL